ncbi:inositol monophosphatase family protein [Mycobacterium sp. CVI_P3]|uniref:Inositol-1-monophosphatase n=1 Tax=Mycobacterium pinniadriaticum TaxID=2994102 RepID=A0ABT3SIA1_9MYCO|nr:inositol monophosphatase family protein [Mycobacterium pinniadriaticum]MCX2932815.1 inositol monophosphatase family protein [Mycobacterium pinniadriaticum]MCX2939239.1 inositol monophosphatase family protein [Mycobacterium pinniadriaticum]
MTDNRPEQLRVVAEGLAAEAAAFVRTRRAEIFGDDNDAISPDSVQPGLVQTKSTPTDPVTIVDTETELLLRDRLATLRPGDTILGEEGGGPAAGDDDVVCWVIDPIDGTVNFVYGIPAYGISIAAQLGGVSVAGAVADVVSGDVYSAAAGHGAHVVRAGQRRALRCSAVTELPVALVGTGFGYAPQRRADQAALLARLLPLVRDVRRIGSASLDLCMVADGRLDAYYEHGLHVWDWAAGALVATEAGATVLLPLADGSGGDGALLLAAGPGIAATLVDALKRAGGLRVLR